MPNSWQRFLDGISKICMLAVGSAFCLAALWMVGAKVNDIRTAWRLTGGIAVTGEIISTKEQIEDCDSCAAHIRRSYDVIYRFRTQDGRAFTNFINLGYRPESSNVGVIYSPANPAESRLAEARQTTLGGAVGLFVVFAGIAAGVAVIGVSIISANWPAKFKLQRGV